MSLRSSTQKRLMEEMVALKTGNWKVMIVDSVGLKILNSVCKMAEINDCQVTLVESITNKRKPYFDYDGIYFVSPTIANIQLIIDDFRGKPPYKSCHLFLTTALSDELFDKIKRSPLYSYIKNLKELNIDFFAYESQVFSLDRPSSIYQIYNPKTPSHLQNELRHVSKQISYVLGTLSDFPYIRYQVEKNNLTSQLGKYLYEDLKKLRIDLPNFPKNSMKEDRATILLLDRTTDVVSPLLHEFTYQAILADLVSFEDNTKIKWDGEGSTNGYVILDDKDTTDVRHKHLAYAIDHLGEGVKKFTEGNKAAQWALNDAKGGGGSGGSSLEQINKMQETLTALPEYQEMKAKFSLHTDLCAKVYKEYTEKRLEKIAKVEQELATGETSDLKTLRDGSRSSRLTMTSLISLFDDQVIGRTEKLRLAMLYLISQNGISDEDRQKLFNHPGLMITDSEIQALTNLSMLGVKQSISFEKSRNENNNPFIHSNRTGLVRDNTFNNCRFVTSIKTILKEHINDIITDTHFSYIEPPLDNKPKTGGGVAALRNTKPSWASKKKETKEFKPTGPRIIVFVLGGMTFSEMRSAYEIMEEYGRDVIIGSTQIYTPYDFINVLKFLHRGIPPTPDQIQQSESQVRKPPPPPSTTTHKPERSPRSQDRRDKPSTRDRSRSFNNTNNSRQPLNSSGSRSQYSSSEQVQRPPNNVRLDVHDRLPSGGRRRSREERRPDGGRERINSPPTSPSLRIDQHQRRDSPSRRNSPPRRDVEEARGMRRDVVPSGYGERAGRGGVDDRMREMSFGDIPGGKLGASSMEMEKVDGKGSKGKGLFGRKK